jgi:hypothetical protein
MQTVRIRRGATIWFPPRKLELGLTHAGWPFICFEISDGWVRARMFRTTIRLASSRRVEINPDPQVDPDLLEVEDNDRFHEIIGALRQAGFTLTD